MKSLQLKHIIILASIILYWSNSFANTPTPIDEDATAETKELFNALYSLQGEKILFGHHNSNISGKTFDHTGTDICDESDLLTSVGDYPAIFSFDFYSGFDEILPQVQKAAELGGIITICYHIESGNGDTSWSKNHDRTTRYVKEVLPVGKNHNYLKAELDKIADFASRAKTKDGTLIPIIFRPWHEHTGAWFWWGTATSTPEEYCQLWQFTVDYLINTKGVHNFLYALSPSRPTKSYEIRNPGAEYIDIAAFDCYENDKLFAANFIKSAQVTVEYAQKHKKIAASAEFGCQKGIANSTNPDWYITELLEPILADPLAQKLAYIATWRNYKTIYWIPLQGDPHYNSFKKFHNNKRILFRNEWQTLKKERI
ncbi:MAG: glycosyl hydrolase [Bacteroidales bacterium]